MTEQDEINKVHLGPTLSLIKPPDAKTPASSRATITFLCTKYFLSIKTNNMMVYEDIAKGRAPGERAQIFYANHLK